MTRSPLKTASFAIFAAALLVCLSHPAFASKARQQQIDPRPRRRLGYTLSDRIHRNLESREAPILAVKTKEPKPEIGAEAPITKLIDVEHEVVVEDNTEIPLSTNKSLKGNQEAPANANGDTNAEDYDKEPVALVGAEAPIILTKFPTKPPKPIVNKEAPIDGDNNYEEEPVVLVEGEAEAEAEVPIATITCTDDADCAADGNDRYCAQGAGVCLEEGSCRSDSDCTNPSNVVFSDKRCMGYLHCVPETETCDRVCGEAPISIKPVGDVVNVNANANANQEAPPPDNLTKLSDQEEKAPVAVDAVPAASVEDCADDWYWRFKNKENKGCEWVAEKGGGRKTQIVCMRWANLDRGDNIRIYDMCKATCHRAGIKGACPASTQS